MTVAVDVPSDLVVSTDEDKLLRLVRALADNAVRYTAAGQVLLSARSNGSDAVVEVRDSGTGIGQRADRRDAGGHHAASRRRSAPVAGLRAPARRPSGARPRRRPRHRGRSERDDLHPDRAGGRQRRRASAPGQQRLADARRDGGPATRRLPLDR